jgi:chromosome segregation ATPase
MDTNQSGDFGHEASGSGTPQGKSGVLAVMGVALILALGGNAYLMVKQNRLVDDVARMQDQTQSQFSKVGSDTASQAEQSQQQLAAISDRLKGINDTTSAAVKRARFEAQRQGDQISKKLDEQVDQFHGEIAEVKEANTAADSKISEVSNNVGSVKTDVDTVKTAVATSQNQLEEHGAELKRVVGDMGVLSGLIATNGKELDALRQLGERNYTEFDLAKSEPSKKIGNITITLKKSDPKRNRYTVAVLADDKLVEKKDRTINEPVQIYIGGSRQPFEIVVNQVKKDQVSGYLAAPKVNVARR